MHAQKERARAKESRMKEDTMEALKDMARKEACREATGEATSPGKEEMARVKAKRKEKVS